MRTIKTINDLKQRMEKLVQANDVVFIAPHVAPDIDAIGSAIATYMIVKQIGKDAYIVIDEEFGKLEMGVKTILSEVPESVSVIDLATAKELMKDKNTLLITTDTNKTNLVPFETFNEFNNILIIDHHKTDEHTIQTDDFYINELASSSCEILFLLATQFGLTLDYRNIEVQEDDITNISNYLLGGIVLDTGKLTKNFSSETLETAACLMRLGADINYVNSLFLDDWETDIRVSNLVSNTNWQMFNIGIAMNHDDPQMKYLKEDLAKAADALIKYKNTDAAFALGYIAAGIVYISARSKGVVDVGEIMHQLMGGGTQTSAAAKVANDDINEVKEQLEDIIRPGYKLK